MESCADENYEHDSAASIMKVYLSIWLLFFSHHIVVTIDERISKYTDGHQGDSNNEYAFLAWE